MKFPYKELKRFVPGAIASFMLISVVAVLLFVSLDNNNPPTASLKTSSDEVEIGKVVIFDGSESSDPDDDDLEFLWTIDGTMNTSEMNFTFSFTEFGTHTVILKVTDPDGEYDIETVLIDVT
ncbi:MAG: PKD domain-containing protein [Candidatus Thermoplasmatota archaeon]|nr:PKD domain-containing protein [Candidatus Thermoplasmatota archaeon]